MTSFDLSRRDFGSLFLGTLCADGVPRHTVQTAESGEAFTAELTRYASRGKTVRLVVFRPSGGPPRGGVVYMHGSGDAGPRQLGFAQDLARDGYLSIVPEYRDAAEDDIVRGLPVMNAWRACASDAVDWLIDQGIPASRTALTGYSLGSFIAVDGALGDSRAAAAVAIAGGWDVYVPRPPARRIPVLIVRAEHDTHVRPQGTNRWRNFLADADVPVRMQVVRGAGHLMNESQWADVHGKVSAFLRTTLAGD